MIETPCDMPPDRNVDAADMVGVVERSVLPSRIHRKHGQCTVLPHFHPSSAVDGTRASRDRRELLVAYRQHDADSSVNHTVVVAAAAAAAGGVAAKWPADGGDSWSLSRMDVQQVVRWTSQVAMDVCRRADNDDLEDRSLDKDLPAKVHNVHRMTELLGQMHAMIPVVEALDYVTTVDLHTWLPWRVLELLQENYFPAELDLAW